jgi:hypothetical protein
MFVYRIEHEKSGMGPFEHRHNGDQLFECIELSYHEDPDRMVDAKTIRKIKRNKWIFGWTSKDLFNAFCSNDLKRKFIKLGFVVKRYNVKENYHIFTDKQIAFERTDLFIILKN